MTVLDKDLLSADDMICAFGPVQLADLPPPEVDAPLADLWLEAGACHYNRASIYGKSVQVLLLLFLTPISINSVWTPLTLGPCGPQARVAGLGRGGRRRS